MTSRTRLGLLATLLLILPLSAAQAAVAVLERLSGQPTIYQVGDAGARQVSLPRLGAEYALPIEIETGADDSAVFRLPDSEVAVAPNTVMRVAAPQANGGGLLQRIFQTAGSSLFTVDKQNVEHFQVETPYLVSVVKGTQFTVVVHDEGATVSLHEGRLQVNGVNGRDSVLLAPGDVVYSTVDGGLEMLTHNVTRASTVPAAGVTATGETMDPAQAMSDAVATLEAAAAASGGGPGDLFGDGLSAADGLNLDGDALGAVDDGGLVDNGGDLALSLGDGAGLGDDLGGSELGLLEDTGGAADDLVSDVGADAGDLVADLGAAAGDLVGDVGASAGDLVGDVGAGAGDLVGDLGDSAGDLVGAINGDAGDLVGDVGGAAGDLVTDIGASAGDLAGDVTDSAGDLTGDVTGGLADALSGDSAGDLAGDLTGDLADTVGSVSDAVQDTGNELTGDLGDGLGDTVGGLGGLLGGLRL